METSNKRRTVKQRRRKQSIFRAGIFGLAIVGAVTLIYLLIRILSGTPIFKRTATKMVIEDRPDIKVELLTPNKYSRSQKTLKKVKGVVIHYTANPMTTAEQNRSYFEGLKDSGETYASSHFVIGLQGEIIQCIPTGEESYASNDRNADTISIECCHTDKTGKFNEATYNSCVELTAWLVTKFDLELPKDVIRHYDITGKICPKYFVDHPEKWKDFLSDVQAYIKSHGTEVEVKKE